MLTFGGLEVGQSYPVEWAGGNGALR
jgi:hypothetical protein